MSKPDPVFQSKHGQETGVKKPTQPSLDSSSHSGGGETIVHVVQGQRDRYMKIAKEKEQEVLLLKTRLDRAQVRSTTQVTRLSALK